MPAEGRENPLLKKGNFDAFFREKYLTKNRYDLSGIFQGTKPLIYQQRGEVQSPLTLLAVENTVCTKLFCHLSIFFNFCKIRIFRLWIVIRWIPIISSSSRSERSSKNSA